MKISISLIILLFLFSMPTVLLGQVHISGALSGVLEDTTYIVDGDILVGVRDSLTIEPGAIFLFNGNFQFNILGYIFAVGTEEDSIKFILNSPATIWGGINFQESSNDSSRLEFCYITGSIQSGIKCLYSNPTISNCNISGNSALSYGGGIYCIQSSPAISNCIICGNSVDYDGGGIHCFASSNPTIENCVISGNSANYDGGGIYSLSSSNPTIINCVISGNSANYGGGIYCISSNPTIVNTIVEGNEGCGGVYFGGSPNASLIYSDFYNNAGGNFTGSVPAGLGQIVGTNANGDPCDRYSNIYLDPSFYSLTGDSAYYLTEDSPCIDAGDPNGPGDPDFTVADMGAYYYDQGLIPSVSITLTLFSLPNQSPLEFNIEVTNNSAFTVVFDIWTMVTLPDGSEFGPLILVTDFALEAGQSVERYREQPIPGNAPAGDYTYDGYIGDYPDVILDEDHFEFTKLATDNGGFSDYGWDNWGEDFDEAGSAEEAVPTSYVSLAAYPNPFNPTTAISYQLQAASFVKLAIYDIQGREVVKLVDDYRPAGTYEAVFNASNLSGGVYFARLTAGNYQQTQKLLLVK